MIKNLNYWLNRYDKQGLMTVGHSSFTPEQFNDKTQDATKLLLRFLSLNSITARKILDFGCGPGRMTKALIPFFPDVYGIDVVPWAVEQAKRLCPRGKFQLYDGETIPFMDGYFDAIISWTVLQHVPPPEIQNLCREIMRVMAKDGKLVMYENISSWHQDKEHIWFRSASDYQKLFDGMKLISIEMVKGADGNDEDHVLIILKK